MIIKAKHNIFIDSFFRFYVIWKMNRSFNSVTIDGNVEESDLPVLLVCNHTSWWDGIWALHVNQQKFHRKYHFMMLEEQLQKNWFFKYTGGFSIEKKSRSVVETLNYTASLLQNKNNIVLMFPQGKIFSMHNRDFVFEKGIEKILVKTNGKVQVVFLANIVDYFADVKPNVTMNITEYKGSCDIAELGKSYSLFYSSCIENQIQKQV